MVQSRQLIRTGTEQVAKATNLTPPEVADRLAFSGAPGEIRTPDLLVRSQTLYPTELQVRMGY